MNALEALVYCAALLGASTGSAAEPSVPPVPPVPPIPWHVNEADIRIPLTVSIEEALLRMPPQVYLADLDPIEAQGIAFDRKNKLAVKANGSATFHLKPEYRWLSLRNGLKVSVDDKDLAGERIFALPPGAKKLRIAGQANFIEQAGFITRGPIVSRADLCLPGLDPTALVPLVYRLSGERVGCRILWAHPTEPMQILFDCSSGETQYLVYLADRSKQPPPLDWAPKAGLIFESRHLERCDQEIKTPEDFQKLWDGASFIAEKNAKKTISLGFLPSRPMCGDRANQYHTPRGAPLALCRYTGFFHIPETQEYDFTFRAWPGGHVLVDDQVVVELPPGECWQRESDHRHKKKCRLQLEKGLHKLDFCQYGREGRFLIQVLWWPYGNAPGYNMFRHDGMESGSCSTFGVQEQFSVWEPFAEAATGPAARRGQDLCASFTWRWSTHWLGIYPAGDAIRLAFAGTLSKESTNAVFRWKFDDGHQTEAQKVDHIFFAPGTRKVELEVLDGPGGKVIARATGNIHAQINWSYPTGASPFEWWWPNLFSFETLLAQRAGEFATVTPIEEVVSLYYWSFSQGEFWGPPPSNEMVSKLRTTSGAALARRIDEVAKALPYNRLPDVARSLAAPDGLRQPDAAEKLCKAVMDRAPAGSRDWKSAAAILADILVSVRGKPQEGLQLLETAEKTAPGLDLTGGWRTAPAKQWYSNVPENEVAGETQNLQWSNACSFKVHGPELNSGAGVWAAKEFDLPASRQGKELAMYLGAMPDNRLFWFNGKRLPVQNNDDYVVIPASLQRYGGKNDFLALFQPTASPGSYGEKGARPAYNILQHAMPVSRPLELCTSADCTEKGVNYTYYEIEEKGPKEELDKIKGDPAKLESFFDKLAPVKKGTLKQVDLSPRRRDVFFAMKFTGYVKACAGAQQSGDTSNLWQNRIKSDSPYTRLSVDSRDVGDQGWIYLRDGAYPVSLIYYHENGKDLLLNLTPPDTFVAESVLLAECVKADALLMTGEGAQAQEILLTLKPNAWPMDETSQLQLTGDLRKIQRWAQESDAAAAFPLLDSWLSRHPMLRTVPGFLLAKMEALAAAGDHARILVLSGHLGRMDLNQTQREQMLLVQVKAAIKAGNTDAARDGYTQLKKIAPYSAATVEAREAITKAVRGKKSE
jgi:hypothetical protein